MTFCIIFDLDGTLVDSEKLCLQALNDVIPALELPLPVLLQRYRGRKLLEIFGDIEASLDLKLPETIERTYRAQVARLFERELIAFAGVEAALSKLDVPMCIASSGPMPKIRHSLKLTGLGSFFGDRVFSAYDVGAWKPDPGLFFHAAQQMNQDPEACIVIEDSKVGLEAARAARMTAVHFCAAEESPLAEIHFNHYNDLPDLIARLSKGLSTGQ